MKIEHGHKQVNLDIPAQKYCFPTLISYKNLRNSLKEGHTKKEICLLKEFTCQCYKHTGAPRQALVKDGQKTLLFRKCTFTAQNEGVIAIDSAGSISLEAYKFYSAHPDWKVRVAVIIGLNKFKDDAAIELLHHMVTDTHWGVKLAAIEALETNAAESAKNILSELASNQKYNVLQTLASRALKRRYYGINPDKVNKNNVYRLITHHQVKKIYHSRSKASKILISHKLVQGVLSKKSIQNSLEQANLSYAKPGFPLSFIRIGQQIIGLKKHRVTKQTKEKANASYVNHLLLKHSVPINHIETKLNPIRGEIYWATTDNWDPKLTRPLLIINSITKKLGYFLAIPLTSDVTLSASTDLIIETNGKKNKVQLARQRVIHASSLLSKYGVVEEGNLSKIDDALNQVKMKKTLPPHSFFHKHRKSHRFFVKLDEKYPDIEETPVEFLAKPNVVTTSKKAAINSSSLIIIPSIKKTKTKVRRLSLGDFFKPEAQIFLQENKSCNNKKEVCLNPR